MKKLILLSFIVSVIGLPDTIGQNIPAQEDQPSRDTSHPRQLKEVIIQSQRQQKEIGAIRLIHEQLSKEMTSDIRDLIRYIPGVGISYSGSRGSNRGFAIRGVEANRVAIAIDGVPQPEIHENMVFSAYGLSNASRIEFDPNFVSAIDIQKGATSFTVGSGALGGAVNYTTKRVEDVLKPGKELGLIAQGYYNSKDNLRMYLTGAGLRKNKWEGLLMFADRKGNEIRNFSYGKLNRNVTSTQIDPMDYKQQTLLGKVAFTPGESHRLEVSYYMLNKEVKSEIWSQEPLDIFTADGKPYYYGSDQSLSHSFTFGYTYQPNMPWLEKAVLKANFQKTFLDATTWSDYYRPNFYGNGEYQLIPEGRRDKYRGQEIKDKMIRADLDFGEIHTSWLGSHRFGLITSLSSKYNNNRNVDVENPIASNDVEGFTVRMGKRYEFGEPMGQFINVYSFQRPINRLNYTISFIDHIGITPRLDVKAGLRYDFFKTKDKDWGYDNDTYYMDYLMRNMQQVEMNQSSIRDTDDGLSWLASANYQFFDLLNLGYKFSTGFRVPTTEERYFQYFNYWPSFLVLSNRDLKPETSDNHEIELSGNADWGTYAVNAYLNHYKNFIDIEQGTVEVSDPLDNSVKNLSYAKNVNRRKAELKGIDIKAYVRLGTFWKSLENFSFNAAASYAEGHTSYGTDMLGIQPLSGFLGLEYLSGNQKWNGNLRVNGFMAKKREQTRFVEKTATREIRRTYPTLFLNDAYTIDLYGSYRIIKDVVLRAGIYNVLNTKYWRWDDLRQLTNPALLPHIENFFREGTKTISRFSQPKRYFSVSLEIKI